MVKPSTNRTTGDSAASAAGYYAWNSCEEFNDRGDAWQQALQSCYLDWELTKPLRDTFQARIRKRPIDDITLVECACSPCSGRRVLKHANKEGQAFVGIQVVVSGAERFHIGDKSIDVGKGDVVFWNSYEPTEFEVLEDLHKITLMMPQALLEARLELGMLIPGGIIHTKTATGGLLYSHLMSLASGFEAITPGEVGGIKWSSVELGAAAAVWLQQPVASPSQSHIRRMQKFVIENLQDPDLSVDMIAKEHGISVRYVHSLFNASGTRVCNWIMDRRIERCRDALTARRDNRGVVKDVALQWGFKDATYFGRVFKKRYGMTPLDYWEHANARD